MKTKTASKQIVTFRVKVFNVAEHGGSMEVLKRTPKHHVPVTSRRCEQFRDESWKIAWRLSSQISKKSIDFPSHNHLSSNQTQEIEVD